MTATLTDTWGETWVTIQQAADLLGVTDSTLRKRIYQGQVEARKARDLRTYVRVKDVLDHAGNRKPLPR